MEKAEQLQTLLDITTEQIREIVFEYPDMPATEVFKNSVENAIGILNQIGLNQAAVKKSTLPVGRVDTTKMAFFLQDKTTAAVLRGDYEFAEQLDVDYVGADTNEVFQGEDEN